METNLDATQSRSVWERVKALGLRLLDRMYVSEIIN